MSSQVTTGPQTVDLGTDTRQRVFSGLWALGHVMHLVNDNGTAIDNPFGLVTIFAAFYLLARPQSTRRLALLSATQLVHVAWTAPLIPDHWTLAAAGNVVILVSLAIGSVRSRDSERKIQPFSTAMPALRVALLIAYSAAAIAKYNTTFLDPVTSCAKWLTETATGGLVGEGDGLGVLHILAALVPETLIPVLLVIPITRRLGVRFGIAFHSLLAISPLVVVGDFTVILTAMFMLFASDEDVEAVLGTVQQRLAVDPIASRVRGFDRPVVVAGGLTAFVALMAQAGLLANPWVWVLFVASVPRVLLALLRVPNQLKSSGEPLGKVSLPHLPVLALFLMWVLLPYAGLRTTGVFTMFSNLRTEGSGTNHIFMPSIHPTDHQIDLVVPGPGSTPEFDNLIENRQAVSTFEVRRTLSTNDHISVAGTRNGKQITDADAAEFRMPNSALANRFLQMRPVPPIDDPPCTN